MPDPLPVFSEVCIEEQKVCKCPTFLRWSNVTGGERFWLFQHNNIKTLQRSAQDSYRPYELDLSAREVARAILGVDAEMRHRVFAQNVAKKWHDWFKSLGTAPQVWLLTNPDTWQSEGAKWRGVIVQSIDFPEECQHDTFDVRLAFTLPEINPVTRS